MSSLESFTWLNCAFLLHCKCSDNCDQFKFFLKFCERANYIINCINILIRRHEMQEGKNFILDIISCFLHSLNHYIGHCRALSIEISSACLYSQSSGTNLFCISLSGV